MRLAPSIVVLSDGAAGNEVQASALAGALGSEPARVLRVRARWPYSALVPRWAPVLAPEQWSPSLRMDPWPQLAVGCGRVGAAALLTLQRASGGATRTVQILDPRIAPERFDLLVVPEHDRVRGPNVLTIAGGLNAIDDGWLMRERRVRADLGRQPAPRTLVLVGGRRRGVHVDAGDWRRMVGIVRQWKTQQGGSLWVVGSRRTPASWVRRLRRLCADADVLWFGPADGENPYRGALAWADRIVVGADSVNMQSEALATGRPVYALCAQAPAGKLGRFHRAQVRAGRLRLLGDEVADWNYVPLRELERIAPLLRERLGL
ncbi:MAG: mitochondrial fission ELM1 family protein [Xanthomonadales bacterium]|nr:mitochondrial fission ELM1 family protein [Xanthomonadales bacterium]